MTLKRKDLAATALTALVVLVFAASHARWNVLLVGSNHRWAAAVILLIGAATCALGSPAEGSGWNTLSTLGVVALLLGMVAMVTGSMTALSLFVLAIIVLWAAATTRHARGGHMPKSA